jgi:hypothetical protein
MAAKVRLGSFPEVASEHTPARANSDTLTRNRPNLSLW